MKPDVLIINSYAGSLTIAATQLGLKIRGSYEDCGYGLKTQRLNFPGLNYVEWPPWPKQDLSKTIVIAHPPCAWASGQNSRHPEFRQLTAEKFAATKAVLSHGARGQAAAIIIESVPGALVAREFYEKFARRCKYHMYYIMLNAATFGVPQWRPRCWFVLTKLPQFILTHKPVVRTVSEVLEALQRPAPVDPRSARYHEKVLAQLRTIGLKGRRLEEILSGEQYGRLYVVCQDYLGEPRTHSVEDRRQALQRFCATSFDTTAPTLLDPAGFSPVVSGQSNFLYQGRPLSIPEYNVLMGFPADYLFAPPSQQKVFLSRGVCPPVARWLLTQVIENLAGRGRKLLTGAHAWQTRLLKPGEMASFLTTKEKIKQKELFL